MDRSQTLRLRRALLGLCTSVALLPGCGRETATRSSSDLTNTTPNSAPAAQPQYGQVGTGTASRVVTNALGQRGLSVNETNAPGQPPPSAQEERDAALSQRIRVALSTGTTGTTGVYPSESLVNLDIHASNGVVTLRGSVDSEQARKNILGTVKSMEGVRGVNDELRVRSAAGR
jgi:hypothetical protein